MRPFHLLDRLDVGFDVHAVTDHHPSGLQDLVPCQPEVLAVDRRLRCKRRAHVTPRVLCLAVLFNTEDDLARGSPYREITHHICRSRIVTATVAFEKSPSGTWMVPDQRSNDPRTLAMTRCRTENARMARRRNASEGISVEQRGRHAEGIWHDSYEAEQHLLHLGQADEPV